jgi:broad specificity phosphatase PhoE
MLYFSRHGQSQANADRVFAGSRFAAPLTPKGVQQAEEEARGLLEKQIHIDHIIASPLERALHTAQIIARIIGIDLKVIQIDPRLAEYDMGDLSGKSTIGVAPAEKVSAPNAEDPQMFQARVKAALHDAAQLPGNTLLVSHAGVWRMIEATKQGLDPARFYELKGDANAHVAELQLK